jgi:hypothetical protein
MKNDLGKKNIYITKTAGDLKKKNIYILLFLFVYYTRNHFCFFNIII